MRSIAILTMLAAACSTPLAERPEILVTADEAAPWPRELYPADPAPVDCAGDQRAHWSIGQDPCAGRRACFDAAGGMWVDGVPFFPRGVYDGGRQMSFALSACPAGGACAATTPRDASAYVAMLADAGFDIILDSLPALAPELLDAVHRDPRIKLAHTLFGDASAGMAAEISMIAADPSLVMWFGPDEVDVWNNWTMAASIRSLLGTSDPLALPYTAALATDAGLARGAEVYDALMPIAYPFQEPYSPANEGVFSTARLPALEGAPLIPVLQMSGVDEMLLAEPAPAQIEAEIMSALARGARGSFYYKLAGETPKAYGRDGWFAADAAASWDAFTRMHALEDRLIPVMYAAGAEVSSGTLEHLDWRKYVRGDRRALIIANPTPYARAVALDSLIERSTGERVRNYLDCVAFTTPNTTIPAYGWLALEVVSAGSRDPLPPASEAKLPPPPPEMPADFPAPAGNWIQAGTLARGRSAFAAAAIGMRELILAGGYQDSLLGSASVSRLVPGEPEVVLPDLPSPAAGANAYLASGAFFVFGGEPAFGNDAAIRPEDRCRKFRDEVWSECAPLGNGPTAESAFAAYDGRAFLFGGLRAIDRRPNEGSLATRIVQSYDPNADAWSAETILPELRQGASIAVAGDRAYVIGGFAQRAVEDPVALTGAVLAYDFTAHAWIDSGVEALPTPRAGLGCVVRAGSIWCFGGYGVNGDNLDTAERLELSTGAWSAIAPLPEPLSDFVPISLEQGIVVAGGLDREYRDSTRIYVLE